MEDDKWLIWGRGTGGRPLQVIFVLDEDDTMYVIHARPLTDQETRHFRRGSKMMQKKYWEMTTKELGAATKHFDQPLAVDQSRPLTAAEREDWRRIKHGGRPKVGEGHKRISVTIEKGLLKRATALAKKRRVSRSKLVAIALEQSLAGEA